MTKSVLMISFDEAIHMISKYKYGLLAVGATGLGLVLTRRYFNGGVYRGNADLHGKTALITGSNTGIGKETAKDFARRGARVILACRDITKAERAAASIRNETGNNDVVVRKVDLASLESVLVFCNEINKTEKDIHLLINNAGIMACPHWKSEDGYEMQFAVNHLGHFLLTNLLLEKVKASAPSRIVNVSSLAHKAGRIDLDDINFEKRKYDSFVSYRQSKLANVLFTRSLHKRLQGTGVTTYSLHPGVILTELGRHMMNHTPAWKMFIFRWVLGPLVLKNPRQGAQTSLHCALAEGIEEHSGKYFSDCAVKEVAPHAKDDEMAEKLWSLSEEMVKSKK